MTLGWYSTHENERKSWTCGYCGNLVGGYIGYKRDSHDDNNDRVYICPRCERPTVFVYIKGVETQNPGAPYGIEVAHVPDDVDAVYSEARQCIQSSCYTAAVLMLRKLLMHVAVEKGAEPNQSFVDYVDFLDERHYIPPDGREWVDSLRQMGNDATHEIVIMDESDAKHMLDFAEMLLKISYEFPARIHET